jgi:aspartokinase-like uncharacterized kinase
MIRVVKVGGSLFDWPLLPAAFQNWLSNQPPAMNVLLAGGGPFADVVRHADRNFSLGEEKSHWLSIDALGVSARLLAALLTEARLISSFTKLLTELNGTSPTAIILDPHEFLKNDEQSLPGSLLPHTWNVTSDSIAARLAQVLSADELVFLKSAPPPLDSLTELAAAGYIDAHLPTMHMNRVTIRFVNLRAQPLALALQSEGKLR